jgi:DNA-binding CsgD family transcriptional regulator
MARDITISTRELTPFEQLVLELVCEGKSNAAIARETSHSEKVVENTVSRSAQVFGIKSDGETNLRVLLALAYRAHYGDSAFDKLNVPFQIFWEQCEGVDWAISNEKGFRQLLIIDVGGNIVAEITILPQLAFQIRLCQK